MAAAGKPLPLLSRVLRHPRTALAVVEQHTQGISKTTFGDLVLTSSALASNLQRQLHGAGPSRTAYLLPPSSSYISASLASLAVGTACVPFCTSHTVAELSYYLSDSKPKVVLAQGEEFLDRATKAVESADLKGKTAVLDYDEVSSVGDMSADDAYSTGLLATARASLEDPALFIYTSGTTGKPKGVVSTHGSFTAQITDLHEAWEWSSDDYILHYLPLHHVHGIQNKLNCALFAGATVEFLKFDASNIWSRLAADDKPNPTLMMGVPTVYAKLLEESRTLSKTSQETLDKGVDACKDMRLHVCGSAALPSAVMQAWKGLTGHTLLERYGMSELGMALGNPYNGDRHEGHVGLPFPSVEVRICDPDTNEEVPKGSGSGELQVRGGTVFKEYFGKPEATAKEFKDGWFCTGDIAEFNTKINSYKILGRASVDIIKSGGYKISALDIEREILEHDCVEEAVVVGVEDDMKGEIICVLLRLKAGVTTEVDAFGEGGLKGWMKGFTAPYKQPSKVQIMEEIPKNAMGKYAKKELKKLFL
ncbi:hypothetical protein TrRE_jg13477 [Triparma retinervis]|uniref:Uncharacterized protein n=1 Tax=Triparma retinervis TaxID=2557542 RepID=A0A9W7E0R7_9STRA|nr:hypothetical protein TrRE_jg13477 [Triparma retinervis]